MTQARRWARLVGLALILSACHTFTQSLPERPTPVAAPLVPLPVLPAPSPIASPPAGPTPSPSPSSPAPAPGSGITTFCSPAIPPDGYPCPRPATCQFVDAVGNAILSLRSQRPELFSDPYVLDKNAYYTGVFRNLYSAGYCAIPDSEEVAVSTRDNTNYRENYQILTSTGKYRTGPNSCLNACQLR